MAIGATTYRKCQCGDKSCTQFTLSTQGTVGFFEEDARLYAASLDLLEVAQLVSKILSNCAASQKRPTVMQINDMMFAAQAAIRKAIGD